MQRLLGRWNPTRGIWETDQMNLLSEHSEPFSETWPTSGMTRSGVAYELPTPALPTADSVSSWLPTPLASDGRRQSLTYSRGNPTLRGALLKTPTSQLAVNGGSQHPDKRREGGHGPTLADEVEHLLPTPAAMNPNDGEGLATWQARRERVKAKGINGNGFGTPLSIAVQLLPTPLATTADGVQELEHRVGGRTRPLSNDGSASPDDSLPPPLELMDETEESG